MTKKDYELIARDFKATFQAIAKNYDDENIRLERRLGAKMVMHRLELSLQSENPRFDTEKFEKACGL